MINLYCSFYVFVQTLFRVKSSVRLYLRNWMGRGSFSWNFVFKKYMILPLVHQLTILCTSVNGMVGVMYVSVTDLPIIADAIQVSRTDVNLSVSTLKLCITYEA